VWNGFVSADPAYFEYAHTPPYDWYTYRLWFDRSGTRNGTALRWKPSDSQMTQCWFKFLFEWSNGVWPPAGKGCYLDDLVLDAVPDNMALETVAPDVNTPEFPPSGFSMLGGVPTFKVPTVAGHNYRIVFKNTLAGAGWNTIGAGTWTPGTGSTVTLTDTSSPLPAERFYRLEMQ
jgi:hypothetical protein